MMHNSEVPFGFTHAQELLKVGAFDYLLKPFRLEVVEQSVKRALEYSRGLQGNSSSA